MLPRLRIELDTRRGRNQFRNRRLRFSTAVAGAATLQPPQPPQPLLQISAVAHMTSEHHCRRFVGAEVSRRVL